MRKEKLLKSILVLIIGIVLIAMSTNVFALSDDDLTDLTPSLNPNTNTDTNTNTNTNTDTNTNLNTNTALNTNTNTNTNTNNYNTNLPDTGVAENTILVVTLVSLVIVAIYAYTKIKYYKNI